MHNDKEMAGATGSADVTRELEAQYRRFGPGCGRIMEQSRRHWHQRTAVF